MKRNIIIGVAVAVAVTLIVVLSVVLAGKATSLAQPNNPPTPAPTPLPNTWYNKYTVQTSANGQDTLTGFITTNGEGYNPVMHASALHRLTSSMNGGNHNLGVNARAIPVGINNQFISNVSFTFGMVDFKVGYLQMTDANSPRYSIPLEAVNGPKPQSQFRLEMLGLELGQSTGPFSFSYTDVTDKNNVLLHTYNSTLVFMDKFIQMDLQFPSQRVFGMGERVHEFALSEGAWTMWAKGQDSPYDDGTGKDQVYGVHPFILVQGKNKGDFFGIFFRNSNAQSPLLRFNDDGTSTLSYITIGGQLEVYFFIHGTAKEIIQSYHNLIGHANLPPFWALGWQQASWRY